MELILYECDNGCVYTEDQAIDRKFVCDNCEGELKPKDRD